MNITVIGTGYVGLVTGTCFAELDNHVTCIDIDEAKVAKLRSGEVPIYEAGLAEMCQRNLKAGRLNFSLDPADSVPAADVIFLALPTPPNEDGSADLSFVLAVAEQLGPLLKDYTVVVNKSTVPVGTGDEVRQIIAAKTKADFDVVSNPEFLREGSAIQDFLKPDRIVVGSGSDRAKQLMKKLYEPLTAQGVPLLVMSERSAEITKYAANSFLAAKISFINEIARLCDLVGANVDDVRQGIGSDRRIGPRFLFPGIGYGGSCFPKDVQALQKTANDNGYKFKTIEALVEVNESQKRLLFEEAKRYFKGSLRGKTLALWGLAYKPETDDIRDAPSLYLIDDLLSAGAKVQAYDPEAMDNVRKHYGGNRPKPKLAADAYEALEDADALLIVTEWPAFREPDFDKLYDKLRQPVIFDGRNLYDPKTLEKHGFYYQSIGRPTANTIRR